ncbi:hypothetical protein BGZ63DRAFT_357511 [Mariannaea sp. PMI_226]|nr:hypothetical protein BGZ63DRAFT_357511 [Mariannaea sp. PMI_226]
MASKPWDLFPLSRQPFSDSQFAQPANEYRGLPLWSWNGKLEEDQLMRQIDDLEAMGFGGFFMHVRVGLDTPYLGEEFLRMVQACVSRAKEKGLNAWLYDEDRWPSGFAGGKVTEKNEEFRARHLLFTPWKYGDPAQQNNSAKARRSELGTLLARYSITLDSDGCLSEARKLGESEEAENIWYAYEETNAPSQWFNDGYYLDTLNKDAVQAFIQTTHEAYKSAVGSQFGKTVQAIFTDEPQFSMKQRLPLADGKNDVFLPWTLDIESSFRQKYGIDLLERLPEVIWNSRRPSKTRYRFHDHVCDRFVEAYTDQIGDWCQQNGLALTGHMMYEEKLETQTSSVGEAMRCYRNMHLPGIDMLCDVEDYTVTKQAQSVSRQYGRCGVLSELYGVTNWTFTFEGHKGQGDWQAALGVNVRCHHLSWLTMAGEAKRDYPAAIGYQSPWYKDYPLIENHFARVNYALTRGKPMVRVGVIHPIESFWLAYGPNNTTSAETEELDRQFSDLTRWLCLGLLDFDFISESLLLDMKPEINGAQFSFGHCSYEAIVLPNLRTIRSTTLDMIRRFSKNGGKVVIAGSAPCLIDAEVPLHLEDLAATRVPFTKTAILNALIEQRDIKAVLRDGSEANSLLYQMRDDGDERYVFICNTDRRYPRDVRIDIRGAWDLTLLDTMVPEKRVLDSSIIKGSWTRFQYHFDGCGSLLMRLSPKAASTPTLPMLEVLEWRVVGELPLESISLSEDNVLLLDMVRYKIDQEDEWSGVEEILRTDNIARKRLGLSLRQDNLAQPYRISKIRPKHTLHLQLEFLADVSSPVDDVKLALEGASDTTIKLDGQSVISKPTGWWVDESISTIPLPKLTKGKHFLELSVPYGELTNIERVYLLGSFGIELNGRDAKMVDFDPERLRIGDYTRQGLPFFAGDVRYEFTIRGGPGRTAVQIPQFAAPLLRVEIDNKPAGPQGLGKIAFQPHRLDLGNLDPAREYKLAITAVGNRDHAFGAVHLPEDLTKWYGPDAWRTNGDKWAYEYTIRKMGLLTAPRLLTANAKYASMTWDNGSVDQNFWFH